MISRHDIPEPVSRITSQLQESGYEAYLVGGCVRDLMLGKTPKDWDVTTNATPEAIQAVFAHTYYDNSFGTVGVVNDDAEETAYHVVEVTPYRVESSYSDGRRPDSVSFSDTLADDLKRRDFTVNALAFDVSHETLVDHFGGSDDAQRGIIRAVGDPHQRLQEDALRMLRAVRLSCELGFTLNNELHEAVYACADNLQHISAERVRDELSRIIDSHEPMNGFILLYTLNLLPHTLPELAEGIGIEQNQAHSFTVFEHNVRTLQHAANQQWPFHVRLAALLHDIAKPRTREFSREKGDWSFHGHDVVGAKMTRDILKRLKFSRETVDIVSTLVRWHMFFSDPDEVTLSAVRRIIRKVGRDHIQDLINLRICDRIGTGRPKAQPFRLRKYQSMIEEALRDPISVQQLAIDGTTLMEVTAEQPGPRIGWLLHALLEEVLEDPSRNTREHLTERAQELATHSDADLKERGEHGKQRKEEEEAASIQQLRHKYHVK
jgi:poly(A) polymerase/tRNA nucleotidyltransferase (CCA-adding enzyme)